MSLRREVRVECPHCHSAQTAVIWDSINVTVDPGLRQKLFDGEINFLTCKKCGQRTWIDSPLLYHDMDRRFCVQYYPGRLLDDAGFLRRFNPDGSPAVDIDHPQDSDCGYLVNPHIVFEMAEMLYYVTFREGIPQAAKGRRKRSASSATEKRRTGRAARKNPS